MLGMLTQPKTATKLAIVGLSLYSLFQWWIKRTRYGGLQGIVSFSARLIAAARAVESEEEDCAIIRDPLAKAFAGPAALSVIKSRLLGDGVLYDTTSALAHQGTALRRKYKVSRIGLRTRWFDQGVLDALTPNAHPLPLSTTLTVHPTTNHVTLTLTLRPPAQQVVILAAGMDARAWRLPLPPDTPVFEIDQPDVVAAKSSILDSLRAQKCPGQPNCTHPLTAASWVSLAADLTDPTWGQVLTAAGFDQNKPTIWVLEGLLMYLDDAQAAALIAQCAALSGKSPGSVLMAGWNSAVTLQRAQSSSNALARTWKSGYPADIRQYFWDQGWSVSEASSADQLVQRFQKQMPGLEFSLKHGGAGGNNGGARGNSGNNGKSSGNNKNSSRNSSRKDGEQVLFKVKPVIPESTPYIIAAM